MNYLSRLVSIAGLSLMLVSGSVLAVPGVSQAASREDSMRYESARSVVSRAQDDLRRSEDFYRGHAKDSTRYKNAQHHLAQFDRRLTKGHFDKETLDSAIADIQHILDHNSINGRDRDALLQDINDLRAVRQQRQ